MRLRPALAGLLSFLALAAPARAQIAPAEAARIGDPLVVEILDLLARRDFDRLADRIAGGGLLVSPYLPLAEGRVRLSAGDLRACATDPRIRHWGNSDGSGAPIRLTCARYVARFLWTRDFRLAGRTSFNRPLTAGTDRDDHLERFPGAIVGWRYAAESRDRRGRLHPWESLHLIFVREYGEWRLAAIARGTWTI